MTGEVALETDRLRLREFTTGDLDVLAAILSDPKVMAQWPRTLTRDEADEHLTRAIDAYDDDGYGFWALQLKATGEFLGACGLIPQAVDGVEEIEVAYMIASAKWRQGFASEAALAVRDWAFEHLDVSRLISLIVPENVGSIGVATKNGMRPIAVHRHHEREHTVYSITRAEWESGWVP